MEAKAEKEAKKLAKELAKAEEKAAKAAKKDAKIAAKAAKKAAKQAEKARRLAMKIRAEKIKRAQEQGDPLTMALLGVKHLTGCDVEVVSSDDALARGLSETFYNAGAKTVSRKK